jgi:transcriptional regulator with XRE-family HTH domain
MLRQQLSIHEISKLEPPQFGEFCEAHLTAETLQRELEDAGPFARGGRKQFCEYLGIGESTLSGWLKEGRIPRPAKEAYVLLLLVLELRERLEVTHRFDEDLKIVKHGATYRICRFVEEEDGALSIKVIADGIDNAKDARLLASATPAMRILEKSKFSLEYTIEALEDDQPSSADDCSQLVEEIYNLSLYVDDFEGWKKKCRVIPFTDDEV